MNYARSQCTQIDIRRKPSPRFPTLWSRLKLLWHGIYHPSWQCLFCQPWVPYLRKCQYSWASIQGRGNPSISISYKSYLINIIMVTFRTFGSRIMYYLAASVFTLNIYIRRRKRLHPNAIRLSWAPKKTLSRALGLRLTRHETKSSSLTSRLLKIHDQHKYHSLA